MVQVGSPLVVLYRTSIVLNIVISLTSHGIRDI